jgi:hypothetical protein
MVITVSMWASRGLMLLQRPHSMIVVVYFEQAAKTP